MKKKNTQMLKKKKKKYCSTRGCNTYGQLRVHTYTHTYVHRILPPKGVDLNVANDALEAHDVNATPMQLQLQLQRDENRLRKRSSEPQNVACNMLCARAG